MSSILKALKKLEQEKVLRGERTVDLALDIHRGAPRRQGGSPVTVGLFILLLILVAAGAWMLIKPGKRDQEAVSGGNVAEIQSQPVAVIPEPAPVTVLVPSADPRPAVTEETPLAMSKKNSARIVAVPASTAPAALKIELRPSAESPREGARNQLKQFAGLKLTGIVWQDDASSRMAIIDDLPVMVGTVISGATVVEILNDRVVLFDDGKTFELLLEP